MRYTVQFRGPGTRQGCCHFEAPEDLASAELLEAAQRAAGRLTHVVSVIADAPPPAPAIISERSRGAAAG